MMWEALREAVDEEMEKDSNVLVIGVAEKRDCLAFFTVLHNTTVPGRDVYEQALQQAPQQQRRPAEPWMQQKAYHNQLHAHTPPSCPPVFQVRMLGTTVAPTR